MGPAEPILSTLAPSKDETLFNARPQACERQL